MATGVSTQRLPEALTIEQILSAPIPAKSKSYLRCPALRGFGVCITPRGARSYFVEARVPGRGGSAPRKTIGKVGVMKHKDALAKARTMLAEIHLGEHPDKGKTEASGVKLKQAFTDYFAARTLRPMTLRDYNYALDEFASWHERVLSSLTPSEVRAEFIRIANLRSANTAAQHFRAFRAVWRYTFAAMDSPPPAPTDVLGRGRSNLWPKLKRRRRVISPELFPKWWKAVDALPGTWPTYFKLLAFTGARKTELLKLEWKRVPTKANEVYFPEEDTKSHRELRLPLGPYAMKLLVDTRKIEPTHDDKARVFGSEVQHKRHVAAIVKEIGALWSSHDLRRAFISTGTRIGVPMPVIKALCSHSLETDTTDGYLHITEQDRIDAMRKIERAILKAAKVKAARG